MYHLFQLKVVLSRIISRNYSIVFSNQARCDVHLMSKPLNVPVFNVFSLFVLHVFRWNRKKYGENCYKGISKLY